MNGEVSPLLLGQPGLHGGFLGGQSSSSQQLGGSTVAALKAVAMGVRANLNMMGRGEERVEDRKGVGREEAE